MFGRAAVAPPVTDAAGLSLVVNLEATRNYANHVAGTVPVSATDGSPFEIDCGGITQIRAMILRSLRGDLLVARLTSGQGSNQRVPFDDLFLHRGRAQPSLDFFTAVTIVGTGVLDYVLAGD
jgi:hypothetical protein